jgi:hypothetical protein
LHLKATAEELERQQKEVSEQRNHVRRISSRKDKTLEVSHPSRVLWF